jgi:hypothetical protein
LNVDDLVPSAYGGQATGPNQMEFPDDQQPDQQLDTDVE